MNKAEEFLLEEGVDDLILSCDKDGEWILASDMMRKYSEHQLIDFYESTCNKTIDREYVENVVNQYLGN